MLSVLALRTGWSAVVVMEVKRNQLQLKETVEKEHPKLKSYLPAPVRLSLAIALLDYLEDDPRPSQAVRAATCMNRGNIGLHLANGPIAPLAC
jgi:hypothetical protein